VLTIDNILKIVSIYFRILSGIPVIIMGETGCGKTALIDALCKMTKTILLKRGISFLFSHPLFQFLSLPIEYARNFNIIWQNGWEN
jgi:ABC-type dipeptide/oligopeptide/nickel transport system ATPase subunit